MSGVVCPGCLTWSVPMPFRDDWLMDGGAVIIGSDFTNPVIPANLVVIQTYTNFVPFLAAMRMRRAFSLMKPSASFWL
jgi:hypothetical protein